MISIRRRLIAVGVLSLLTGCAHPPATRPGIAPDALTVRVMTYNIQSGGGDLTRVAQVIRAAAPDVIGLQEGMTNDRANDKRLGISVSDIDNALYYDF